jgi:DNA-binding NarL/FixJ family response regulator
MTTRIPVYVYAHDMVLQAGVGAQLRGQPEVEIVESGRPDEARVAIIVADVCDEATLSVMRAVQRNGVPRVIGVIALLDECGVVSAAEAGVSGLLRRSEATTAALLNAIRLADRGEGSLPPDLLGALLSQVRRVQEHVLTPRGLTFHGLSSREIDVLKMVADGFDTSEIADSLCYSQRTVKNVLHDVTVRFNLRNRSHAVAYAVRQGLI